MDHADHVNLIRGGVTGSVWADLGAGSGAFTLALADVLEPAAEIHAVDRDARALRTNQREMGARFPNASVRYYEADFTKPLELPALDGIVMANSLHFQRDAATVLAHVKRFLAPGGRIVVVEYNIERGNYAVPYPVPFSRWQTLASAAGFGRTELMVRRPSRTFAEIYSAMSG
ncbi:MAG: class I SAM-dependent methyltransferase [Dehalococcoidia bacterium]